VLEQPKPNKETTTVSYDKWAETHQQEEQTDATKPTKYAATFRGQLQKTIDYALAEQPETFDELLSKITAAGYEYKPGKFPAFRAKGQNGSRGCVHWAIITANKC
jgi:hypothetical protein